MDDRLATNRRNWDERAGVHPGTDYYDVEGFLAGGSSLRPIERDELDVEGRRVAHLMCHFGLDTMSWARAGASEMVGLDFSSEAIERARDICGRADLTDRVSFVEGNVYDARELMAGAFDVVAATYGILFWLPDVSGFVETAASLLAPGGTFYLLDHHPFANTLDAETRRPRFTYFDTSPFRIDEERTYADPDVSLAESVTYEWFHTFGDVVTAVVEAGLEIDFLHEHPVCDFEKFHGMARDGEYWVLEPDEDAGLSGDLPMLYSIRASKPEAEP